jgi:hypothetical protein
MAEVDKQREAEINLKMQEVQAEIEEKNNLLR